MSDNITAFDSETVLLEGSNLIEASAGTGKTYSIAILALRLLLEKEIEIQQILMVTFTKAAVAELQERIRKFIREAYKYATGNPIEDEKITAIVDKSGKGKAIPLLRSAIINLDETAVYTIHSFCQQTLNEFAFETNQIFNAELTENVNTLIEGETQKFWREHVTGIEPCLLRDLLSNDLSQEAIISLIRQQLDGKSYLFYDSHQTYSFSTKVQSLYKTEIQEIRDEMRRRYQNLLEYVINHQGELVEQGLRNPYAKKYLVKLIPSPEAFIENIFSSIKKNYVSVTYQYIADEVNKIITLDDNLKEITYSYLNRLYAFAIQEIKRSLKKQKSITSQLSFDDLINNLHSALVVRSAQNLKIELCNKYRAVFIDEFQDTDRKQYEIFHAAFQKNNDQTILFYIGDPKQSIYGWRKADIATYMKAGKSVNNRYTMNINYRSTPEMVKAMNQFFLPKEGFDTFFYQNESDRIDYREVEAVAKDQSLIIHTRNCTPISIGEYNNNTDIYKDVARTILDLLTNKEENYFINKNGTINPIAPSDIAVLVRSHIDAGQIKKQLNVLRIPSVTKTDAKILQSAEATEVLYILEAITHQTRSDINRALLCSFTGWKKEDIENLNGEITVRHFRILYEYWQKHGLYATIMKFADDFNVQQNLLSAHSEDGERIITNLYHLAEVLYKAETQKKLGNNELIDWLRRNISRDYSSEDELVQRIESDEDSVNIVTIHSSKGLQYPIVFAPSLDLKVKTDKKLIVSFRDNDGNYLSDRYDRLNDDQKSLYQLQEEQENRRLLYVTITRAIYSCFIFQNNTSKLKNTTLKYFTSEIQYNHLIGKRDPNITRGFYSSSGQIHQQFKLKASGFSVQGNEWQRMSYSRLAAHSEPVRRPGFEGSDEGYDIFIFKKLSRGAHTGNFLHFIFENLNFSNPETWVSSVKKSIQRFESGASEEFESYVERMVHHVMKASFYANGKAFKLREVAQTKTLHELEFDFPVSLFSPQSLRNLRESGIAITPDIGGRVEGVMNGKIDLFFEYAGKYYILDWKSNYLGPSITDYEDSKLTEAMDTNNYHLQYLIYTLAVKKYLMMRLGHSSNFDDIFGGVFYVFLRGVREDKGVGIFYTKPTIQQINKLENLF